MLVTSHLLRFIQPHGFHQSCVQMCSSTDSCLSCRNQLLLAQPLRGLRTALPLPLPSASQAGAGRQPVPAAGHGPARREPARAVSRRLWVTVATPGDATRRDRRSRLAPAHLFPLCGVRAGNKPARRIAARACPAVTVCRRLRNREAARARVSQDQYCACASLQVTLKIEQ